MLTNAFTTQLYRLGDCVMTFAINHIHLKSNSPRECADWWVKAFNFRILADTIRDSGDQFIACESENGMTVNISGPQSTQTLTAGDHGVKEGLEHFGLDSENLESDIERLTSLGAELLDGPIEMGAIRICFLKAPDNVRIELIQRD